MSDFFKNAHQTALNTALQESANASKSALSAQKSVTSGMLDEIEELEDEIARLKRQVESLQEEGRNKDLVIERKDEFLRQWIISQTAFKNLFKRYGVLPDGRRAGDVPDEERIAMVKKEQQRVAETGDGMDEATKKTVLGGK